MGDPYSFLGVMKSRHSDLGMVWYNIGTEIKKVNKNPRKYNTVYSFKTPWSLIGFIFHCYVLSVTSGEF